MACSIGIGGNGCYKEKGMNKRKYEEKLEAFAACFFLMLIMFLLIVIGAVGEMLLDVADVPAYTAIEYKIDEDDDHDQFH